MKSFFLIVLFLGLLVSCGKTSDEEYLAEAQENIKQEKVAEAIISYETLVKEYPESKHAPEALFQIATIYQNQKVKNINREDSFEKADSIFKAIVEKYPDSEKAPVALFMAGFVEANELNNYDEATKTYNLFLEIYPDHELASSANEELENMGLSPEEILKKNVTEQQ